MPTILRSTCSSHTPTSCFGSPRPERLALALLAFVAQAALAQQPVASKQPPRCESVVIVRCDRAEQALPSAEQERARQQERRRPDLLELDRIVIEADPIKKGIEESMSRNLGTNPSWGTRTFTTGEGSQCTCMNICPPWPLPCCQCSNHMRGFSSSPGSSIFN
jgi:hypothetical protein